MQPHSHPHLTLTRTRECLIEQEATQNNPQLLATFHKLLGVDAVLGDADAQLGDGVIRTGNAEADKELRAIRKGLKQAFAARDTANNDEGAVSVVAPNLYLTTHLTRV